MDRRHLCEPPAHVSLLVALMSTARPLYDRPNEFNGNVVGYRVRWTTDAERDAYNTCVARGLLTKATVAVPGECHPFEEAEVLTITKDGMRMLNRYTPECR